MIRHMNIRVVKFDTTHKFDMTNPFINRSWVMGSGYIWVDTANPFNK